MTIMQFQWLVALLFVCDGIKAFYYVPSVKPRSFSKAEECVTIARDVAYDQCVSPSQLDDGYLLFVESRSW